MPRPHSHGRGGPRICCRASRKKSADLVEVKRPNDQRERYLSIEELRRLEPALDTKMYRQGTRAINQTFYRLRLLVLIALTTGMRMSEIFALTWSDVLYREGLIAVRSKLKGGKIRYVPMTSELATEIPSTSLRSWERITFSRQSQARKVSVREWREVFRPSWNWRTFGASVFTNCGTASPLGT